MKDRILIVDDEDSLRLSMKMRLKGADFEVDDSADAEAALDKIRENQYDVVLLDVRMPNMSGLDALPLIIQTSPKTDVIMMTGFADFSDAIECLKAGARDYLVKPIEVTELITRLKTLLRTRQSERELQNVQHHYSSILFYDLFGPLMTIRDVVQNAQKLKQKEQEALLEYATELSEQLWAKVRTMLDFSHIEAGSLALNRRSVNVNKLVSQVSDRQAILAQQNKLTVTKKIDSKLPSSHCDPEKIEQVLNYFLAASIRHSEPQATILLTASRKAGDQQVSDQIQISVRSDKSRVKEEDLSILFHKNGKPVDPKNAGLQETVLNLAIAKRIVEAHGGLFWIGPKEGRSLQYNFTIPVA